MMYPFIADLEKAMTPHGFREIEAFKQIPECELLLRLRTININRAIVVVSLDAVPEDLGVYMLKLRNKVARRCKYFPILWGLGIQAIVTAPGIAGPQYNARNYVAEIDNQWAIIQSVFLVDVEAERFRSARSRMQIVTGKYQDIIEEILYDYFAQDPPALP